MSLAEQYAELWRRSDSPPNVFQFLASHPAADPFEQLNVLLTEQTLRWSTGQGYPAERYFKRLPTLFANSEFKLAVVYGEFGARRELGESPGVDELKNRFPDVYKAHVQLDEYESELGTEALSSSHSTIDLDAPLQIDDYQMGRKLGQGGMGHVYQAVKRRTGNAVAIKLLRDFRGSPLETINRFLREGKPGRDLRHPNIVPVHGVGRLPDGGYFLVMDLLEGGNLEEYLKRTGPLAIREAVRITVAVADAIAHAHDHGVIHRDLKPSNVLLDAVGGVQVSDFGIAQMLGSDELSALHPDQILGTPEYMAPEQADRTMGEINTKTDVYGIGGVLYSALVVKPPFQARNRVDVIRMVTAPMRRCVTPRQVRPEVPQSVNDICMKCLSQAQANRYQSAHAVSAALRAYQASVPPPA